MRTIQQGATLLRLDVDLKSKILMEYCDQEVRRLPKAQRARSYFGSNHFVSFVLRVCVPIMIRTIFPCGLLSWFIQVLSSVYGRAVD